MLTNSAKLCRQSMALEADSEKCLQSSMIDTSFCVSGAAAGEETCGPASRKRTCTGHCFWCFEDIHSDFDTVFKNSGICNDVEPHEMSFRGTDVEIRGRSRRMYHNLGFT